MVNRKRLVELQIAADQYREEGAEIQKELVALQIAFNVAVFKKDYEMLCKVSNESKALKARADELDEKMNKLVEELNSLVLES